MTTDDIITYYANLAILQFINKPKARETIKTVVAPVIMDQLPNKIINAFNINEEIGPTAQGVQLDIVGKYAGVSRIGNIFSGPTTLNDADFLKLIQISIIQNTYDASLATIQALLNRFFSGEIFVFDHGNMHMDYFIDASIVSDTVAQFFVKQKRLPKPTGVQLGATIYAPVINNFFGFGRYAVSPHNVHGFNRYTAYDTGCPWLRYSDAI